MKETLSSIAERTGFSVTTVSRVLSGNAEKHRICQATRDKVLEEARRCHYKPSLVAQSLRTTRSKIVGLLLPGVANPYFAEMAQVAISELKKFGYTTIIMDTMEEESTMVDDVLSLVSRQAEGILVVPCGTDSSLLEDLDASNVPIVLIDRFYKDSKLSYVTTNNYQGGLEATRYLISNGHSCIACIKGVESSIPGQERVKGYMDAMNEYGFSTDGMIVGNEYSINCGYIETKLLLSQPKLPTAIFALGNTIAMGALKAIREHGMKIPDDISLITFDNNVYLDYINPVISRVSQPVDTMTRLAVKILIEKINSSFSGFSQLRLSPKLIPGDSVRDIH